MTTHKLTAGQSFPALVLKKHGGGEINVTTPNAPYDWRMLVVYRGKHCPICTTYLKTLNELLPQFHELGVDVIAASADSKDRADAQLGEVKPDFEVAYDMSIEQMQTLGLYVSEPRSPNESDRPFAEPGLFIINEHAKAQIIDISNAPFARPDFNSMLRGLRFIRNPDNNYPIRGTYS